MDQAASAMASGKASREACTSHAPNRSSDLPPEWMSLSASRGAADGKLLESTAVAAHGMPLEVCKNEHRVICRDEASDEVFLEDFAVRNGPYEVRTFAVHDVNHEPRRPSMLSEKF